MNVVDVSSHTSIGSSLCFGKVLFGCIIQGMGEAMNRRGFISLYIWAAIIVVCLICLAVIMRNCRKILHPRQPREPRYVSVQLAVVRADTGASLVCKSDRKRAREQTVTLEKIEAPITGKWADVSRDHLKEIAGGKVMVKYLKHGILRDEAEEIASDEMEARGPLIGVVTGESGIVLNLAQVEGGYAKCVSGAPEDWNAAQNRARKAKLGVWSGGK